MLVIKYTPIIFPTTSVHFCASLFSSRTDQPQQDICYVKAGV